MTRYEHALGPDRLQVDRQVTTDMLRLRDTLHRAGIQDMMSDAANTINERQQREATRVDSHLWLGCVGSDITAIQGHSLRAHVDYTDKDRPVVVPDLHIVTYARREDDLQADAYIGAELFGSGKTATHLLRARLSVHLGTIAAHPTDLTTGCTPSELTSPEMISALFYTPSTFDPNDHRSNPFKVPSLYARGYYGQTLHSTSQLEESAHRLLRSAVGLNAS